MRLFAQNKNTQAMILLVAILVLMCGWSAILKAQDIPSKRIVRSYPLDSEDRITRFILSVLRDRTVRADPFIKNDRSGMQQVATYEVEEKPRPASGLGKYDVEQLRLQAIWKEENLIVAMVRSPDEKVFVIKVGDEAYDGRVVEINLQAGFAKFLQELKRTGGPARPGDPDVKYVEKIVRIRR